MFQIKSKVYTNGNFRFQMFHPDEFLTEQEAIDFMTDAGFALRPTGKYVRVLHDVHEGKVVEKSVIIEGVSQ